MRTFSPSAGRGAPLPGNCEMSSTACQIFAIPSIGSFGTSSRRQHNEDLQEVVAGLRRDDDARHRAPIDFR
jgi:hypothetical protein